MKWKDIKEYIFVMKPSYSRHVVQKKFFKSWETQATIHILHFFKIEF